MNGLYALKPWYAARLRGVRGALARREVSPDTLTAAGVVCAAGAATALAWLPAPVAALPVAVLLAARLGFANLDGALARDTGRTHGAGRCSTNSATAPPTWRCWPVSWRSPRCGWWPSRRSPRPCRLGVAGRRGGGCGAPQRRPGRQDGAVPAGGRRGGRPGWAAPVLAVIAAGSALTAAVRCVRLWRVLGGRVPGGAR